MLRLKLVVICRTNVDSITNNEIEKYLYSLLPTSPTVLKELEIIAESKHIPIVGPMIGRLLHIIAIASNTKHVLEFGTAIGYSAIWLGLAVKPNNGKVMTIEINSDLASEAVKNIRRAGLENTIKVVNGNSLEIIPKIKDKFDLIFIDDSKENYPNYLDHCIERLNKNGLLIADNALWRGEVTIKNKSKDADAIATFNKLLMGRMPSVIIPARDGLAIGVKQ